MNSPSINSFPWRAIFAVGVAAAGAMSPIGLRAQGCVAVRGGTCSLPGHDFANAARWNVGLSYRWLHSHRHFVGDEEQVHRAQQGTEVINKSHFVDTNVTWQWTPRTNLSLTVPFVTSDRTSFYEHSGGSPATGARRYGSQATGLSDLRVGVQHWLFEPSAEGRGNVQVGLSLKLPTGDYRAEDTFVTVRGPERHFVDQSIQPGDGGWGVALELQGHYRLPGRFTAYGQVFYLFNPRDTNGVSTEIANPRGRTLTALQRGAAQGNATAIQRLARATALGYATPTALEDVMSVSDQYLARAGVSWLAVPSWGLALSLGVRAEGVPVEDLWGDSNGFRRPGYTYSVEPGISVMRGGWSAALFVPYATYRTRVSSVADRRWDEIVGGGTRGGDAAFADYVVTFTVSRAF